MSDLVDLVDVLDSVCDDYTVLPSAQTERQWIPCSERLPEDEELVLVTKDDSITVDDEYIEQIWTVIGFIREGVWHWGAEMAEDYWPETNRIIAWMPLPEPYKEDNT